MFGVYDVIQEYFCIEKILQIQGFRKYKNEVSSPSKSRVLSPNRFYMEPFQGIEPEPHTSAWRLVKKVIKAFFIRISQRLKYFKNEVNS